MPAVANSECTQLAGEIRNQTRMLLAAAKDDLAQEQAVFQLLPSRTHILWLIGHITVSLDYMVSVAIGRTASLPESYHAKFMFGVKPSGAPSDYPPIAQVIADLNRITEEVATFLENSDDSVLDRMIPVNLPFHMLGPTARGLTSKGTFHAGYHTGQITLLRAAQGLPAGFGL